MKHTAILTLVLFSGCGRMLGFEKDYVLREPLKVQFAEHTEPVIVPAGTHVKQSFYKDGVSFVSVYGSARQRELAGGGEQTK